MEPAIAAATTKHCPHCSQTILATAKKCRHCGRFVVQADGLSDGEQSVADRLLNPVNRPVASSLAGYYGVLACFPVVGCLFAALAVLAGAIALRRMSGDRYLVGWSQAVFGIFTGAVMLPIQSYLLYAVLSSR